MRIRKIRGSFSPKPSSICRIMSIPVIRHIYVIQRSILRLERMSDKKNEFVPAQKFIGMQVIDSKGSAVGTVRDLGINVGEKKFNLIVTTKTRSDVQVSWEDIQSVVDVILLRKEIEIPKSLRWPRSLFLRPRRSATVRIAEHRSSNSTVLPKCGGKIAESTTIRSSATTNQQLPELRNIRAPNSKVLPEVRWQAQVSEL